MVEEALERAVEEFRTMAEEAHVDPLTMQETREIRGMLDPTDVALFSRPGEITLPSARSAENESAVSSNLLCPISGMVLEIPVITPGGITYSRRQIEQWLARSRTCPVTRQPLTPTDLVPNRLVASLLDTTPPLPQRSKKEKLLREAVEETIGYIKLKEENWEKHLGRHHEIFLEYMKYPDGISCMENYVQWVMGEFQRIDPATTQENVVFKRRLRNHRNFILVAMSNAPRVTMSPLQIANTAFLHSLRALTAPHNSDRNNSQAIEAIHRHLQQTIQSRRFC